LAGFGAFVSDNPLVLYASVALFGVLGWVFMPVVFTIPMELPGMTPDRVGVLIAVVLSAGNLSGFLSPLIVGFLRDRTGDFAVGLGTIALVAFALAIAGLLIPETGGRPPTPAAVGADGIERARQAS